VTCAIYWGRCSLIRLLVVMSVVVVLVLLFISLPVDGVEVGTPINSTCHILDSNIITIV